jgi:tetratricopeptide (TPR) repeat protein
MQRVVTRESLSRLPIYMRMNMAQEIACKFGQVTMWLSGLTGQPSRIERGINGLHHSWRHSMAHTRLAGADTGTSGMHPMGEQLLADRTETAQSAGGRSRRPPIWGREIPFRNPHFTGRTRQLEELRSRLESASTAVIGQPVLPLYGLGGVGKTEIAAEYAHRYRSQYTLCWWVRSEQEDLILNSLVNLGRMMQLPDLRLDERDYSVELVMEALNRGEPYADWLLIFDNASQSGMVARYIPRGPGHVIITSRDTQWRRALGVEGIEVAEFELPETVEFLCKRIPALKVVEGEHVDPQTAKRNKERQNDAAELAKALDNLPVAADHAGAYIAETGISIQRYLKLYNENAHKLFAAEVDITYPRAVATTWSISRKTLSEEADALFTLMAFFAPEPIYEELLLQPGKVTAPAEPLQRVLNEPAEFRRATRELARFSLIKINSVRNVVQMHRVVRAVTQGQLEREDNEAAESLRSVVHSILAASDPNAPDRDDSEEAYERSRQHIVASGALGSPNGRVRRLVINQVHRLYRRGGFTESLNLGEFALKEWQSAFGDDSETLGLAVEVAAALRRIGRWEEALRLNAETLSKLDALHNGEDPTYLKCARGYGIDLNILGRYKEAYENDIRLLPLYEKIFGADDLETLQMRNNVAISLRCLGRFDEALAYDKQTYEARLHILGPTDTGTLTSRFAVARNLRRLGQWYEALDIIRDVSEILERKDEPWNQFRLLVEADFGVSLRRVGDYAEAAEQGEAVLERYNSILGETNRDTLRAAINIINDRRLVNKLDEAYELGEKVVSGLKKIVGENHPNTVAARANLANVLLLTGNTKAAITLGEQALEDFTRIFGAEHPSPLVVMTNFASGLAAMGEIQRARDIGERSLELHRRVRGVDHPCTLATATNLSMDRRACGDSVGGEELLADSLRRFNATLGQEHPWSRRAAQYGRLLMDIEPMMD